MGIGSEKFAERIEDNVPDKRQNGTETKGF